MIALLDHAAALIVGAIVLVAVMLFRNESAQIAVERNVHYSVKKSTLALGEIIERDLVNIGFDALPGDQVITRYSTRTVGTETFTDSLEFRGMDSSNNPIGIRYVVAQEATASVGGESTPVLSLLRFENDGTGWVPAGGAKPSLIDFDVDLLNESNTVTDVTGARKLRVRFKNAVLSGNHGDLATEPVELLNTFFWGITIEPAGLRRQSYQG